MGDKGGDTRAGKAASTIAKRLYENTRPIRRKIINKGEQFLEGDFDVSRFPWYQPARAGVEDQYGVARENILANMPTGGQMYDTMANLEMDRANSLANIEAQMAMDEYNKIYGMATGAPQQSLAGLTSLAGSQAAAQAQQTSAKYGALGDIGAGAGLMMGMK